MGNSLTVGQERSPSRVASTAGQQGRKRCAEESIGEQEVEEVSPRRKRIQTTSDYIFETLYNKGADSDITICALGE